MMRDKFLLLILLLLLCEAATAQEDGNAEVHEVEEVEVVARRNDDVGSLTPRFSLGADEFVRLNITDIATALHHLPGVLLRDYGGAGGMKTVSVRGLGAAHTGVAIDGLLLSDQLSGSIDFQQFLLSEVGEMKLWVAGSDDIFQPARNIQSSALLSLCSTADGEVAAEDSVGGIISLTHGSWEFWQPSLRLCRVSRRQRFSVGGTMLRAENDYPFTVRNGIATHGERRVNNHVRQGVVNASHRWMPKEDWSLQSTARYAEGERELPGLVRYYVNESDEELGDRSVLVQTALTGRLAARLRIKAAARWNWTRQDYRVGSSYMGIRSECYTQREYYATMTALYEASPRVALSYAADFFHNALRSTTDNPRHHRNSLLQALSAKWGGGRLSAVASLLHCSAEGEDKLSPSASASFRITREKDLFVRVAAKRSFRLPTMAEQYYFHIGTQHLKPETAQQLNVGLTYSDRIGRVDARLTADAYINKVDDKIVCIPYNMFVWSYKNLGRVRGEGIDATAQLGYSWRGNAVQLSANHSLQSIRNQTVEGEFYNLQIAYIPLHSGTATLSWTNPWANCSATINYASETWATNEHHDDTRIAGYSELSLTIWREFRVWSGRFEASLAAQNLFDREYCIVARYPMPGRNLKATLKYNF